MNPEQTPSPTAQPERTWKRRWYTYPFVNPRLQIGMTFVPLLAGAVVALYFSYLLYLYSIEAFTQLTAWFPDKAPTQDVLAKFKSMWLKATIFIAVFELMVLPILGLFFSHRLAGPLLVVTKRLKDLKNGKFPAEIKLRKSSFLQDFVDDFNECVSHLRAKEDESKKKLEETAALLKSGKKDEAEKLLQELIAAKSYSLSSDEDVII